MQIPKMLKADRSAYLRELRLMHKEVIPSGATTRSQDDSLTVRACMKCVEITIIKDTMSEKGNARSNWQSFHIENVEDAERLKKVLDLYILENQEAPQKYNKAGEFPVIEKRYSAMLVSSHQLNDEQGHGISTQVTIDEPHKFEEFWRR